MGYLMLGRRTRRLELRIAVNQRIRPTNPTSTESATGDIGALHLSLNTKKEAVRTLVAFAHELAGMKENFRPEGQTCTLSDSESTCPRFPLPIG